MITIDSNELDMDELNLFNNDTRPVRLISRP